MGREKGIEMSFLGDTPEATTLRSPGFITATMETIQGDYQKAQERQENFSDLLV